MKYQCKNCGKHWTKIHVERRPLPGQYVEDEGEDEKAALDRESDELASEEA